MNTILGVYIEDREVLKKLILERSNLIILAFKQLLQVQHLYQYVDVEYAKIRPYLMEFRKLRVMDVKDSSKYETPEDIFNVIWTR